MSEEVFVYAFVGGLILSVVALIVGIWLRPRKGVPGWIMVISTLFFLMGTAGLLWIVIADGSGRESMRSAFTFASLTVAVVLFAFGFVWDRVRRSRE